MKSKCLDCAVVMVCSCQSFDEFPHIEVVNYLRTTFRGQRPSNPPTLQAGIALGTRCPLALASTTSIDRQVTPLAGRRNVLRGHQVIPTEVYGGSGAYTDSLAKLVRSAAFFDNRVQPPDNVAPDDSRQPHN